VSGDLVKTGFALAGVSFSLLWGFWPDLRRKKRTPSAGSVAVQVKVDQAEIWPTSRLDDGR
jgi:hypothetical protein